MSKKRRSFLAAFGVLDWTLTLVAFAAIGYGAYSGFTCKDDWEKVAAPLFSLASGFLFVVALLVQLREHRQTIEEMEQANTNHADLLSVAKQEKEFNVCLRAAEAAIEEMRSIRSDVHGGVKAIEHMVSQWAPVLKKEFRDRHNPFQNLRNVEDVFVGFNELYELNVRMYWTLHAVASKDLATEDKAYLNTLIFPVVREVGKAQGAHLTQCIKTMDELLELDKDALSKKKIEHDVLSSYRGEFQKLYDARKHRPVGQTPI